jgi:predicted dienelactone hydrolase
MKVVPKQILTALFSIALLTLIYSSPASATERLLNITLDDGSDIKVFLFEPDDHGDGPWPLTILISGGTGNEYIARAQFWLGRKLAEHGWAIAVPVSPDSKPFTGENAKRIPKVIAKLQKDEKASS